MGEHRTDGFAAKHGPGAVADPAVQAEIEKRIGGSELACAMAFEIAKEMDTTARAVGRTADLMDLRLVKCQLGLFGYGPAKKIVKARACEDERIAAAIRDAASDGRLSCRQVWEIAARFKSRKLTISGYCEAMDLRIKPCQLGAF